MLSAERKLSPKTLFYLLLTTFVYSGLYFLQLIPTPLGQVAVLDGQENLLLARQIAEGALSTEPFFRAMGYPLFLSIPYFLGGGDHSALIFAQLSGLFLHVLNTYLIFRLSGAFWRCSLSAYVSSFLYGLCPVLIYFALEPLDIIPGITLFLVALCLLLASWQSNSSRWLLSLLAGLFLGLAVLTRPHFMFPVLGLGLITIIELIRSRFKQWTSGSALVACMFVLIVGSLINLIHSGHFKILPYQGAYNLWAANNPESNGKYFVQTLHISLHGEHENPAKIESLQLYQKATGVETIDIDEMNSFWREKTSTYIKESPGEWLGLIGRKLVYLFNNYEQYNNKTFSFQKETHSALRFNPLSWGLFLIMAGVGLWALKKEHAEISWRILILAAFYAGGVIAFYVSARFRLPMYIFLVVAAGGIPLLLSQIKARKKLLLPAVISGIVLSVITFPGWNQAKDTSTYVQDHLLTAIAASQQGRDAEALSNAQAALLYQPENPDAHHFIVLSIYNLALSKNIPLEEINFPTLLPHLNFLDFSQPTNQYLAGVIHYRTGNKDKAYQYWQQAISGEHPNISSLAALHLTHMADGKDELTVATQNGSALAQAALNVAAGNPPSSETEEFLAILFRNNP